MSSTASSSPSFSASRPSQPSPPSVQPSPTDLLLLPVLDPSRPKVTWPQLWTGDGLPESDRQIVAELWRSRVLTPSRRYIITVASSLWGLGIGAMSASAVFINRCTASRDPDSMLRKDMARIAVQHNPNRAMEVLARERIAQLHGKQQQRESGESEGETGS